MQPTAGCRSEDGAIRDIISLTAIVKSTTFSTDRRDEAEV